MPHAQDMELFDIRGLGPQVAVQKGHAPRPCSYIVSYHMCRFQVSVQKGHAPRPTPHAHVYI